MSWSCLVLVQSGPCLVWSWSMLVLVHSGSGHRPGGSGGGGEDEGGDSTGEATETGKKGSVAGNPAWTRVGQEGQVPFTSVRPKEEDILHSTLHSVYNFIQYCILYIENSVIIVKAAFWSWSILVLVHSVPGPFWSRPHMVLVQSGLVLSCPVQTSLDLFR